MLWCHIQRIRERKSRMVMEALAKGWGEPTKLIYGDPPEDENEVALYGQVWGTERILPRALQSGRTWWYIDNGYWHPGRGSPAGYYRMCYRAMGPVLLSDPDISRGRATGASFQPWRASGSHILFAAPGADYGQARGLSMAAWSRDTLRELRNRTDRPIKLREYGGKVALDWHLRDCWALVTYASNIAVEAVLRGIPVFVAPESAAAPVGNTDLMDLESPRMPARRCWWESLMCQQFQPSEMADGTAYRYMQAVREQVDAQSKSIETAKNEKAK